MATSSENIAAVAALSKIAEIQQFELGEDYSHLVSIELVRNINAQAKQATGIDLLAHNKKISIQDYDKYEAYLDSVIEQNLQNKQTESFLSDSIDMLLKSKDVPLNTYRDFNISQDRIMPAVKKVFKSIGMSVPSIIPILKNPISIQQLNDDSLDYLVVSKFEVKSRMVTVLFNINVGTLNIASKLSKFSELHKSAKRVSDDDKGANVLTCFLFNERNMQYQSPVNLFIAALSKYGKDITIDFVTKKFFLTGYSSNLLIQKGDELMFSDGLSGIRGTASFSMKQTYTGYTYTNLYLIALDRMVRDFGKFNFI